MPERSDNNDKPDIDKVLKHILDSVNQRTDDHEHTDTTDMLETFAIDLSIEPADKLVQSLITCMLSMADTINSTSVSHIVSCIDDKNVSEAYRRTSQYLVYGMFDWMGRDKINVDDLLDVITDMMTVQIAIINYVMDGQEK